MSVCVNIMAIASGGRNATSLAGVVWWFGFNPVRRF